MDRDIEDIILTLESRVDCYIWFGPMSYFEWNFLDDWAQLFYWYSIDDQLTN